MKKKVYQKHYAFIVENPEDEFWEKCMYKDRMVQIK